MSCDGQYFNLGVEKHLDEQYEAVGVAHHDHDPIHRAGLVDTHLRNPRRKDFSEKWLNDIIETISQVFDVFNWGKEFEHLLKAALEFSEENPEFQVKNPLFFSATRFANYSERVFKSFLVDIPILVKCLEENQMDDKNKNRMKFATLSNKIMNVKFLISLSGVTDVYRIFSELVQKLQIVFLLPHERYDQAMSVIEKFSQMMETIDINNCCCSKDLNNNSEICLWPNLHQDISSVQSNQASFRSVPVGMIAPEELNTRHGLRVNLGNAGKSLESTIQLCKNRLSHVLDYLVNHLKEEVFSQKDKKVIENVRNILCL